MKPLEWKIASHIRIGHMQMARRGQAAACVWLSDLHDEWVCEVEIGGGHGHSFYEHFDTEAEAKKSAEARIAAIAREMLGES